MADRPSGTVVATALLRSNIATVFTLLAGVAVVAVVAFFVARVAPDGGQDLRAYEAATRCPAVPTRPADCLWTQEFTVSGISLKQSKSKSRTAVLTAADGARWESHYSDLGPVLDDLEKGDRVTGTIWRGLLTKISADGASQETHSAPADMRARILIGALIVAPPGVLVAAVCVWRLRRRAAPEPTPGMVATLKLAVAMWFGGLFSPIALALTGREEGMESFWIVAAAWLLIAAVLVAATRVRVMVGRAG